MSRVALPAVAELALAAGLPKLLDLLRGALPRALSEPLGDYRADIERAGEEWARGLLVDALCPPTQIDASAGAAPVARVKE